MLTRSLLLSLVLASTASAAAEATLKPGAWQTTARFTSFTSKLLPVATTEALMGKPETTRDCLTVQDVRAAGAARFMGEPARGCVRRDVVVRGGKISMTEQCSERSGASVRRITGTYTPTSFRLTVVGKSPTTATTMVMDGRWTGPQCEAENDDE